MKRRSAFGMISHITPVALPVFLVVFYAPIIALPLRMHGWGLWAALGVGFAVPLVWGGLGIAAIALIPARFAKLKDALGLVVVGPPIIGVFGIVLWDVATFFWRWAH